MREVVKYGNKFNRIDISKNFNTTQANIFFAIISRLRDKGNNTVTLSFNHIAQLSGIHYGNRVSLFTRQLKNTYNKILRLNIYQQNKDEYEAINLFSKFKINRRTKTCTIKVNPDFTSFLNNLAKQFTRFSIRQYTTLRSKYAKTLFRIIKTFRTSGNVYLPMKKFKVLLNVPKSYSNKMITQKIVTPSKIQLTPLVRNLHFIPQRKAVGNRVTGYHIQFKPENTKLDKLIGFKRSNVGTKRWMVQNVKYNSWLTQRQKQKAYASIGIITQSRRSRKISKREPMKAFNRTLRTSSLSQLRYLLSLHDTRSKLVNFSEYQVRKLKKCIVKKHNQRIKNNMY